VAVHFFAAAISSGGSPDQIVIGAEVNQAAVADGDVRLLRRRDDAFFLNNPSARAVSRLFNCL
jgi:hypothetical protein